MPQLTQQFSRMPRSRLLRIVVLGLFGIFTLRLFYIQVIQHGYYDEQAKASQVSKLTIAPERGKIYAHDGAGVVPLVLNETVYTVFADPSEVTDASKVTQVLKNVAGGNIVSDSLARLTDKSVRYIVLARQVSRTQAELIQKENVAGIGLQKGSRRVYPEQALAAQTLGYVNTEGTGQYGLEEALQARLVGTPGTLEAVTDVRRIPLTIGKDDARVEAKNGDNLVLSVDRNIQSKAEQVLRDGLANVRATKGSVLVMDPRSGHVLAMANFPTYDPSKYGDVQDYSVFQNAVVSAPYEAGSVMKTLTVGAGLDSGAVNTNTVFNDSSGCATVDDRKICNVEEDPRQANATMLTTLRYSLNTGVVFTLRQMGGGEVNRQARDTLYSYFHSHYRFGQLTGIEQAGETPGTIIAPDQQEGNNVRYANMAFGQGMDVTMIQAASAFSAAINGGRYYQPSLIDGTLGSDGSVSSVQPKVLAENTLSPAHSAELRDLIWQARKQGFFGPNDPEGYKIGGKTGTSQVIDPKTGKYSNDNSIGSYLGFGGAETPEYVIMVRVDDSKAGGYAGTTAAGPIFNTLSNWLLKYLNIEPMR